MSEGVLVVVGLFVISCIVCSFSFGWLPIIVCLIGLMLLAAVSG